MGKKVRKALNVATFGLSGAAEKLATPLVTGPLTSIEESLTGANISSAMKSANAQAMALEQQKNVIAQNAAQLAASSVADNTANVVAGGSAGMADENSGGDLMRKRRASISSVLGV